MTTFCRVLMLQSAVVLLVLSITPAAAQTIDWTGLGDGTTYQSAANWDGVNIPDTASEDGRFGLDAPYDVVFGSGSSTTVGDLLVNDGVVTFATVAAAVTDATYTVEDQAIIDGGTLVLADSLSTFNVNLDISNQTPRVGDSATGGLTIQDGSQVTSTGGLIGNVSTGNGTVRVTGGGSKWMSTDRMDVGVQGTGLLYVLSGGEVDNSSGPVSIGKFGGGVGNIIVSGTDGMGTPSRLSGGGVTFVVGESSSGSLTISDGGEVSSSASFTRVGFAADGVATVTGNGSSLSASSFLTVGTSSGGVGELTIENGGLVTSTTGALGFSAGSTGMATAHHHSRTRTCQCAALAVRCGDGPQCTIEVAAGGWTDRLINGE